MVLSYQCGSLNVFYWFLHVVALRISQPFYEILQLSFPPLMSVAMDGLNFILFIAIYQVRWWLGEVFSMFYCFDIWG